MDTSISKISEIILSTDVTPDVNTTLCILQQRKTTPEPLDSLGLPPLMLPPHLAQNPTAAAQYLRQVIEADKQALNAGKIPDVLETMNHIHIQIDQTVGFKMLCLIRDHYQEKRAALSAKLYELIKPCENGHSTNPNNC